MYASTKLRKIREICNNNGHDIDECRIKGACLSSNFDIQDAAQKLLKEENFKIKLFDLSEILGYYPSKNIISWCCEKKHFNQEKTLKYFIKISKSRIELINKCQLVNITEDILDNAIIAHCGYVPGAHKQLMQDFAYSQVHR
jgi:uncharacterized ubiquitin-like protein YukD